MINVLLVDPDTKLLRTVGAPANFSHEQIRIDWAQNAFHARALLKECHYDIVLIERAQTGMAGESLLPALNSYLHHAKVALLSGLQQPPGNGVRPRPTSPKDLVKLIMAMLTETVVH